MGEGGDEVCLSEIEEGVHDADPGGILPLDLGWVERPSQLYTLQRNYH